MTADRWQISRASESWEWGPRAPDFHLSISNFYAVVYTVLHCLLYICLHNSCLFGVECSLHHQMCRHILDALATLSFKATVAQYGLIYDCLALLPLITKRVVISDVSSTWKTEMVIRRRKVTIRRWSSFFYGSSSRIKSSNILAEAKI